MSKKYIAEPDHVSLSEEADYGFQAKLSVGWDGEDDENPEDSSYSELELVFWPHGDSGSISLKIPYVKSTDIGTVIEHLYEIKIALKTRETRRNLKG